MPKKTWILTDVDADIYQEQISLGPGQVGGPACGYRVTKRTLRGGRREGVDVVEVDNGRLRFVAIPTRGMGLWRATCGDVQLGWKSPVKGPVHPAFVPLWEASGLGWLGGFDELLVRCGLESNGAPEFLPNGALRYPLHGLITNTPAHKVEVTIDGDSGEIAVTGVVDEVRMFGSKLRLTATIRTQVGSSALTVSDEITNLSAEPGELELLYHINFGLPLLTPGAKVVVPVKKLRAARCDCHGEPGRLERVRAGNAGPGRGLFLLRPGGRRRRPNASAFAFRRRQSGGEREVQQEPVALLHAMEEPASGRRWLCDRFGAVDQFPQSEIVRKGEGPRSRLGAGRDAPLRGFDRGPCRRCRGGHGRKGRRRAAGLGDARDLSPSRPAVVTRIGRQRIDAGGNPLHCNGGAFGSGKNFLEMY